MCAESRLRDLFFKSESVVKSRLQVGNASAKRYKSTFHGLLTIFKEEGLQGLYGGAQSKLLQSVLTAAILFAAQKRVYDFASKVAEQRC